MNFNVPFAYSPIGLVSWLEVFGTIPVAAFTAFTIYIVTMIIYRICKFAFKGTFK